MKISIKLYLACIILIMGCSTESDQIPTPISKPTRVSTEVPAIDFKLIDKSISGIDFMNEVDEYNPKINYFVFNQLYSGAGVGVGDLNNDGLTDILFQSNLKGAKLYANQGDMKFKQISIPVELLNNQSVGTGVNLVDINGDGLLDIYLCYTGPSNLDKSYKSNKLLINKGDFKFEDGTKQYNLGDTGNSIQSAFFDYDKDGDLDMYLVNTNTDLNFSERIVPVDQLDFQTKAIVQLNAQDRLYQNQGGVFQDVTTTSGLVPEYFYGFNPTIGDYNNDGWDDVFITNDFTTPDLLYINQQDGTFKELSNEYLKHTSFYSMGADAADINNDGMEDIVVVDMTPEDYRRSRENMGMVEINTFQKMVDSGFGKQYMHNMLHLNNGVNGFREIGQFAGIHKTDWSWAVLNEDFNNDGNKDMYVTNGIARDIVNKDSHKKRTDYILQNKQQMSLDDFVKLVNSIPSEPIPNYLFTNNGDLTYSKSTGEEIWNKTSFSNGAATADFDNDGDIDIIVNNFNQDAFLIQNTSTQQNYLNVNLVGPKKNSKGIGATVQVSTQGLEQTKRINNARGYMSSTDYTAHFGIGSASMVEYAKITWPDGKYQMIKQPKINTNISFDYKKAKSNKPTKSIQPTPINEIANTPFHKHEENAYNDFENQILLPHKLSNLSPALASADVNNDGLTDIFIGGGQGQAGVIYIKKSDGNYEKKVNSDIEKASATEDTDALFFDIDNDKDLDLMVVSGSFEYKDGDSALNVRVYRNDGKGNFSNYNYGPVVNCNSMAIASGDMDGDGDIDIFIGGRVIKDKYPYPAKSILLQNDNGKLVDITQKKAADLSKAGMITDAEFVDVDGDEDLDLVVVGEWMPITMLENKGGQFTKTDILSNTRGWWNTIEVADFNKDGKQDLAIGNLGLNYKFSTSEEKTFKVFCDDFDSNGSFDIVLAKPISDELYPVRGKMCSSEQMPFLKDEYPTFNEFAGATINDILGEKLDDSYNLEVKKFESCVLINKGNWQFDIIDMPAMAQVSPIKDILAIDCNDDGHMDLITVGNLYDPEVETSQADAGIGTILLGNGSGSFSHIDHLRSGFFADKDVRRINAISDSKTDIILVNNNASPQMFSLDSKGF